VLPTVKVPGAAGEVAIRNKSGKRLKHESLQFRIKKGQCFEIIAINLLKEKKPV
jgi:hypothetical protein